MAVGCAISMVAQRNPLYSAISLIGVFISLACLYVTLSAPFIAAVQVIVYAGAIMVLVVFVIMLLNVDQAERQPRRLRSLVPIAVGLAAVLFAEAVFMIFFVQASPATPAHNVSNVGLTSSIGTGLFTGYLLPFEITSILLLMAIVGAMSLARRGGLIRAGRGSCAGQSGSHQAYPSHSRRLDAGRDPYDGRGATMNRCRLPIIVGVGLLFLVSSGSAQAQAAKPTAPVNNAASRDKTDAKAEVDRIAKERRARARSLLISLASDARSFRDQTVRARTLARIADALWDTDVERGRELFRKAWEAAGSADQETVRKRQEDIQRQRAQDRRRLCDTFISERARRGAAARGPAQSRTGRRVPAKSQGRSTGRERRRPATDTRARAARW